MKVLYLCDKRACEEGCDPSGLCKHTSDIRHAKNFESCKFSDIVFSEIEEPAEQLKEKERVEDDENSVH